MQRLAEKRVIILTSTKVTKAEGRVVQCSGADGEFAIKDVDTVIAAIGTEPERDLPEMIKQTGIPTECITDTASIYAATSAAADAVRAMCERFK